jgi:hypothetical protein
VLLVLLVLLVLVFVLPCWCCHAGGGGAYL